MKKVRELCYEVLETSFSWMNSAWVMLIVPSLVTACKHLDIAPTCSFQSIQYRVHLGLDKKVCLAWQHCLVSSSGSSCVERAHWASPLAFTQQSGLQDMVAGAFFLETGNGVYVRTCKPAFNVKAITHAERDVPLVGVFFSLSHTYKPYGCSTTWWLLCCHMGRGAGPVATPFWCFNSCDPSTECLWKLHIQIICPYMVHTIPSTYSDTFTVELWSRLHRPLPVLCQGEAWRSWRICLTHCRGTLNFWKGLSLPSAAVRALCPLGCLCLREWIFGLETIKNEIFCSPKPRCWFWYARWILKLRQDLQKWDYGGVLFQVCSCSVPSCAGHSK